MSKRALARRTAVSVGSALGLLVIAAVALFLFGRVTAELPFGSASLWAHVGVGAALLTAVVAIATAVQVGARHWGRSVARWILAVPVAVLLAIGVGLYRQPTPMPVEFTEPPLPMTPQDVLILLDPGDAYVRSLVRRARSSPSEIAPNALHSWGTDVAFGIAVLNDGRDAPWSLVSAPTVDRAATLRALASIRPTGKRRAPASLDGALRRLADRSGPQVRWRKSSARTIAFATEELPTDVRISETAIARLAQPPEVRRPSLSVWYRQKAASALFFRWLALTQRASGNLGQEIGRGRTVLDDLAQLSLNRYYFVDSLLAEQYRPHLKFDAGERFRPLDVMAFVAEKKPELCTPKDFRPDDCERIESAPLLDGREGYLRLGGVERGGRDLPADDRDSPQKLYYRVTRTGSIVNIEYWWFFRYNVSPVLGDYMCLAGLSVAEGSCFDHQGDWEGVTVSLVNREGAGTRGGFVSYTGHGWPGYRYRWETLSRSGAIADETHPVVYVAFGSHASYPRKCAQGCTQLDFRHDLLGFDVKLPDGGHDGRVDWPANAARTLFCGCLEELPAAFDGRPLGWNAFRGQWGAPACSYVFKSCLRSLGPPSPAHQHRFSDPLMSVWASVEEEHGLTGHRLPAISS